MAHNAKRSLLWLCVAVVGAGIAAVGTMLDRPASGALIILGLIVGLVGIAAARMNTDFYDFDQAGRDRDRDR
jgi:hypothetical protein